MGSRTSTGTASHRCRGRGLETVPTTTPWGLTVLRTFLAPVGEGETRALHTGRTDAVPSWVVSILSFVRMSPRCP